MIKSKEEMHELFPESKKFLESKTNIGLGMTPATMGGLTSVDH